MSQSNHAQRAPTLAALDHVAGIPRDAEGPVFRAPWEAQAFALTLSLYERGLFSWPEWADALAERIKSAQARGERDDGTQYYTRWLEALERITTAKGLVGAHELSRRKDDWDRAARATPHGKPIELQRS